MSSEEGPNKDLEAQNKALQEEARKQIEEDQKRQTEAAVKAAQGEVEEADYTFQGAAKALEEVEQPPNMGSAEQLKRDAPKAPVSGTPPPLSETSGTTTTEPKPAPRRTSSS